MRFYYYGETLGHPYEGNSETNVVKYLDNGEVVDNDNPRPCTHCNLKPDGNDYEKDNHDPCIKNLPGVHHACCGHGIKTKKDADEKNVSNRPYVSFSKHANDGITLEYQDALDFFKKHGKGPDSVKKP